MSKNIYAVDIEPNEVSEQPKIVEIEDKAIEAPVSEQPKEEDLDIKEIMKEQTEKPKPSRNGDMS